jgi:deoxycytidine triphosphate deaminase
VVLSDKSIREQLESGGIVIEPLEEGALQPSSVDLRVDRFFRVFRNDTTPFIDPKQPQEDLTELVEVEDGGAFILHPGEFVLGSTLERVALGPDLVARLEGKSSLGRLGLLIHSSLPAGEPVMLLSEGRLEARPIGEVVERRLRGSVVSFDPATLEVGYHRITGWYQGPPDRIYEIRLASGRRVRVTAGHNLFTLDQAGHLSKIRTGELRPGSRVAIPDAIPEPPGGAGTPASSEHAPAFVVPTGSETGDAARRVGGTATVVAAPHTMPELDGGLGDLRWDSVVEVGDTGSVEPTYDLEVRPGDRTVENFLAGNGGVFVSNTAGFVDAGWDGHLTLELSNVANLPIAIYPGMKIGQISFLRMSTEAEQPYGSEEKRSKYQGQRGPTPSRYYLNFGDES